MSSVARAERALDVAAGAESPSVAARHACRAGNSATTAGVANGYVQGNLAILPEKFASAFHRFCQLNPKPCPIIGMSDVGNPKIPALGLDLDIRTDLPRYRVWKDGELDRGADRHHGALARRSRGLRDRLFVFIRRGSARGRHSDPPYRARSARSDVPHQYRLRVRRSVRGTDGGLDAAAETGRCHPRRADHLALSVGARRAGSSRDCRSRSASPISRSPTTATPCRLRSTKFRCSGLAA